MYLEMIMQGWPSETQHSHDCISISISIGRILAVAKMSTHASTTICPLGAVYAVSVMDSTPISSHCCHALSSTHLHRFFSARLRNVRQHNPRQWQWQQQQHHTTFTWSVQDSPSLSSSPAPSEEPPFLL
jgi:hypothetical protein